MQSNFKYPEKSQKNPLGLGHIDAFMWIYSTTHQNVTRYIHLLTLIQLKDWADCCNTWRDRGD